MAWGAGEGILSVGGGNRTSRQCGLEKASNNRQSRTESGQTKNKTKKRNPQSHGDEHGARGEQYRPDRSHRLRGRSPGLGMKEGIPYRQAEKSLVIEVELSGEEDRATDHDGRGKTISRRGRVAVREGGIRPAVPTACATKQKRISAAKKRGAAIHQEPFPKQTNCARSARRKEICPESNGTLSGCWGKTLTENILLE